MRHLLSIIQWFYLGLIILFISASCTSDSFGQSTRPVDTFYLRPQVGIASYVGDHNKSLFSFDETFPISAGIELGYQFNVPFSLGLGYQFGQYPEINGAGDAGARHGIDLIARYNFGRATGIAPFIHAGGHATFGKAEIFGTSDSEQKVAFGPLFGLGVDIPLSNRISFFIEGTARAAFPDEAIDGREGDRGGSFDLLSTIGTGLKINFKSAGQAPQVVAIEGPVRLNVGEAGSYRAQLDRTGSSPVEYRWEWGDGTSSSGLNASHHYATPGSYTIRFTASNRKGADTETLMVTVVQPKQAPQIASIAADPSEPDTDDTVRFSTVVRGDGPFTYQWNFGDGSTGTGATPTHRYDAPGTFNVSVTATNEAGTDSRNLSLRVNPATPAVCNEISELNAVYFGRNASLLTPEGRNALDENIEILLECPNLDVRIEGWAAPGERNPDDLSEDRARVVEEYYASRGISQDRLETVGMGRVGGTTSKKDGAQRYQRVDSIVVR